jgi:hypothetical protein
MTALRPALGTNSDFSIPSFSGFDLSIKITFLYFFFFLFLIERQSIPARTLSCQFFPDRNPSRLHQFSEVDVQIMSSLHWNSWTWRFRRGNGSICWIYDENMFNMRSEPWMAVRISSPIEIKALQLYVNLFRRSFLIGSEIRWRSGSRNEAITLAIGR